MAIEMQQVSKKYPNGTEALKSVSLRVCKGQFFVLLGPNGAGKSTLIKVITTLIHKNSGHLTIGGLSPTEDFLHVQQMIGVASQDNDIDPAETVENLLIFQGRLFGKTKSDSLNRARELLELFQLDHEKKKKAGMLSGGNKRRLHCALALVHEPKILFLDEPTVGMDPEARVHFWEIITDLNRNSGITIFLTTQYLEEADKYASEMALLIHGEIQYAGSIDAFKKRVTPENNQSLEESYLHFIKSINHSSSICKEKKS